MVKLTKKQLLLSTLISGAMMAASAAPGYAQDNGDEDADIIVTGTRINRPNLVSASPVTTLDRTELLATGITDVGDIIQSLPSMSGSPIGTTTNNGGNGSVFIDLRGLGAARTLTLVNGQRTVDAGDFQTIPSLMIGRLDVLKDGASAVYGADAVSGVVNIITRSDFDGIELSGQHAVWDNTNNGEQTTMGLMLGKQADAGGFVFGAEYVIQDEVYQRDTPWDFFQDSYYIYPEGCEDTVTAGYGNGGCYPIGSSRIPESRLQFLNQGRFLVGTPATQPYEVGDIVPHDGRNYNYAPVNYVQTPYDKLNLFAEGHFDLNDTTKFNIEVRGGRRESAQELAPQPYNSPTDPAFDGTFDADGPGGADPVAYSGISEQNYYLRRAVDRYNAANGVMLGDPGSLIYEPIRDARRRMIETTRRFEQSVSQLQGHASLDGEWQDIEWELYGTYGFRTFSSQDFGQFFGDRLSNALGPSADLDGDGQPECYGDITDPSTLIAGCVPFNFFGGGSVVRETGEITAQTVTDDMINYVSGTLNDTTDSEFVAAGFGLAGDGFDLPAGKLGWAAGAGLYNYSITDTPDSAKQTGNVTGNKSGPTSGSVKNLHAYAEILAPLYDNGQQQLEVTGGLRYDDFENIGNKVTYQIGVKAQLVDALKVRGTYGTVFRAPTVFDLFQGASDSFPTYTDPCIPPAGQALPPGCAQVGVQTDNQVLARVGGNPNLRPELGDSLTLGAVLTPNLSDDHNITITVDYFNIDVTDGISSLGVQTTLNNCYVAQNADACALITRRADYSIAQIVDAQLNVAKDRVEGIDTEFRWNHEADFGDLNASLIWTHLLERSNIPFAGEPVADFTGRYVGAGFSKDKFNYSVGLNRGIFGVTYRGEYVGGLEADTFCNCSTGNQPDGTYRQDIPSQLYHDVFVTLDLEDKFGANITAGVSNLTDKAPPFIETGFNAGTEPANYRVFGRGFYVRGTKTF